MTTDELNELSHQVIGAALEVHRELGAGLLESVYEQCLTHELGTQGISVERQVELPVRYKGIEVGAGYRVDLVVANALVVEIKAVESILPVHSAQLLTYLKLMDRRLRLLLNFNVPMMRDGIRRVANGI